MTWGQSSFWIKTLPCSQTSLWLGSLLDRSWTQRTVSTLLESVQRYNVRYPPINSCHCCFSAAPAGHHSGVRVWRVWARVWRRVCRVSVAEAAGRDQTAAAAWAARPVGRRGQWSGRRSSWLVKEQLGGRGGGGAVGQEAVEQQLMVVWGWGSGCRCHHHVVMLNHGGTWEGWGVSWEGVVFTRHPNTQRGPWLAFESVFLDWLLSFEKLQKSRGCQIFSL